MKVDWIYIHAHINRIEDGSSVSIIFALNLMKINAPDTSFKYMVIFVHFTLY